MSSLKLPIFYNGDWVTGKTINDEIIQGFIHSIHPANGTVKIRITKSDNKKIVGKTIETFIHRISPLTESIDDQEVFLENLIDVALLTKDKDWFLEVWDRLAELRKQKETTMPC
ncbi:hypothetical protein [Pseudalkalibacillus berkeleyi]|uniref:IDEAL domain-containing protein n=1 Tax=Pseudalkalibacillus berkeleyi TaxID=1069813 RepID=A0ABS9H467_9BACL|nr:hypothetical protein [Pseudalkalibacillus berkeleyi]MCF6138460.1 hypothetical protein [Pseudalkalibacillus berkeleyi]